MSGCVRELSDVLSKIKQGMFMPDSTRSGRFKQLDVGAGERCDRQNADMEDEQPGSDTGSDYHPSSDSEISDETDNEEPSEGLLWLVMSPGAQPEVLECSDEITVYRHELSGVQHLCEGGENRLMCGRRLHDKYVRYAGPPVKAVHLCDTCRNRLGHLEKTLNA